MGLLSVAVRSGREAFGSGIGQTTVRNLRHRAFRRSKGKIQEKVAVAATAAVAEEGTKAALREAGRQAEVAGDNNGNTSERWSFIGMFIPDSTLNAIGAFILENNKYSMMLRGAQRAEDSILKLNERAAGLVSRDAAKRFRIQRMNRARTWNRRRRMGMSKRKWKKFKENSGRYVDYGLAAAETILTGGGSIEGQLAARAGRAVARQGLQVMRRRATRQAARRAARQALKQSVN